MLLKHREIVRFNPADREHRLAIKDFLKRNAWSDTSYRFFLEPEYHNLVDMCQTMLLDWYLSNDLNADVERKILKGVIPTTRHTKLKAVG